MNKTILFEKTKEIILELNEGKIQNILETDEILNLGMDSLKYAQLMFSLEEFTGKSLIEDDINWSEIKTISQLNDLFL